MNNMKKFFSDFESFFNSDFDSLMNPFNTMGETKTEKGEDSNGQWVKQTFTSKDGSYKMTSFVRTSGLGKTPSKSTLVTKIGDLKAEMEACVEKQEFEKAAKLRDKIKSLETNKDKVESLKKELELAVSKHDFEKAIEIRDTLKELEK